MYVVEKHMKINRSYWVYSVGIGIVWAVILILAALLDSTAKRNGILLVFGGFAIGWISTTIARYVYPPPSKWTRQNGH